MAASCSVTHRCVAACLDKRACRTCKGWYDDSTLRQGTDWPHGQVGKPVAISCAYRDMRKHSSKPANIRANKLISKADSDPNNIRTPTKDHSNNYTTIIAATNNTMRAKSSTKDRGTEDTSIQHKRGKCKSYILDSNNISTPMAIKQINHQPSRSLSKELNLASKLHNRYKQR